MLFTLNSKWYTSTRLLLPAMFAVWTFPL